MEDFVPGQRWLSDAEPELGLGLLTEADARSLTLDFRQSGQQRRYARANAPLSRIRFSTGDELRDRQGLALRVLAVEEDGARLRYRVQDAAGAQRLLPEAELGDAVNLDQPLPRLLAGQVDNTLWYHLRARSLEALRFIESQELLGLYSARTDLLPHQLYIAHEVARRHAPRVLLADEVGLGKTIEAGLILQQQLFSGRAARVLILVPETLLHQWLVEMLRRFTLAFSLFDEERCAALEEEGLDNPFFAEQFVLCSSSFFQEHPERHAQALAADWDLLIVDEAHHLRPPADFLAESGPADVDAAPAQAAAGTPDLSLPAGTDPATDGGIVDSPVAGAAEGKPALLAYRQLQAFAAQAKGLVLLTATPDQGGQDSQFALLHLLDPQRFHDPAAYRAEQARFAQVADLVESIEGLRPGQAAAALADLAPALKALLADRQIAALLEDLQAASDSDQRWETARHRLIEAILDRHGTGRVLFRNTRKSVAGFPPRLLHAQPLPWPEAYAARAALPQPEIPFLAKGAWLDFDPRLPWLLDLLEQTRDDKLLLICALRRSAEALEEHLRLRQGLRSAVFHEGMSIVERDRAAAWFADPQGARILVCSEIGSEGRNFQFSHRLVLFDLPRNPDLLEQRIGRLDRIGQRQAVDIHVPWLRGSAQEVLFRWYHEALDAFSHTNPVAFRVYRELEAELDQALESRAAATVEAFLAQARALDRRYREEHARGRDRLLELHSYSPREGERLLREIRALEAQDSPEDYLLAVLDSFGIDAEARSAHSWVLQPGEHMLVEQFGSIPDEGMTLTFSRDTALQREDLPFVTWQHPLVLESIDTLLQGYYGKTAVGLLKHPKLPPGSLLLEALYRVQASASRELQLKRFLPCTTLRVLVDSQGRDLSAALSQPGLQQLLARVDRQELAPRIAEQRDAVQAMAVRAKALAEARLPALLKSSSADMLTTLSGELKRLAALREVNPNVRQEELDFLKEQVRGLHAALQGASLQLEGLLLVFVA